MDSRSDFNLVEDPWLPVTTLEGTSEEWGLREFFHKAHVAQGLNLPSPLAYTVVLRLLLAISHRALQGPATNDDWMDLWDQRKSGFAPARFDTYLDRWKHRFNLFDPVAPFAQVTDFKPDDTGSPISRLVLEQTSGSNSTLFDHSRDDVTPEVTPATAAQALLGAHQYAFAGTAGRYMQAPMVAGYAVSWESTTLFETLLLNLVRYDDESPAMLTRKDDAPFWELDDLVIPNKQTIVARGLTDLYTFRGRRLQLIRNDDGMVRRVRYDQGLVLDLLGESLRDPSKRYLAQKQANAQLPRNFSENRALWRDADGLIEFSDASGAENEPPLIISELKSRVFSNTSELKDLTPKIVATGLVNNQARISLWRMDRMTLPLSILGDGDRRNILKEAIELAERAWSDALRPACRTYASIGLVGGTQGADSGDITAILTRIAIERRYWSRLDQYFQDFLDELGKVDDLLIAQKQWKTNLRRLCENEYRAATNTMTGKRWYQAQSAGGIHLAGRLKNIGLVVQKEEVTA